MTRILQIGAGSMGTRRLRDLHRRRDVELALFDARADRRAGAEQRFRIQTFDTFEAALAWRPEALVISTPPGTKRSYIEHALGAGLHHFSEADMWTYGAAAAAERRPQLVSAVSASLLFLPVARDLRSVVAENLGEPLAYQAFLGTYMPAWHPHEGLEYYARHRDTSPAREMVPFELSYLNALFGPAASVAGSVGRHGRLPGETEDTWTISARLARGGIGQLAVTMASPEEFRRGWCSGTRGWVCWDLIAGTVGVRTVGEKHAREFRCGTIGEVLEPAYQAEINAFVDAIHGGPAWAHRYREAQQACAMLAAAERSAVSGTWTAVEPDVEPDLELPAQFRIR